MSDTKDFWDNVPTIDATESMSLFPKQIDLEKAVPGDPEHCIYAECIRRVLKTRRVRIWRTIALIEDQDEQGRTVARRYEISTAGQRALEKFDSGIGQLKPCHLLPPSQSHRLETKRARVAAMSETEREVYRARARERANRKRLGVAPKWQVQVKEAKKRWGIRSGAGHHPYHIVK